MIVIVVVINLEKSVYTVIEGSSPLEVCVTAIGGQINNLATYICTVGNSALGKDRMCNIPYTSSILSVISRICLLLVTFLSFFLSSDTDDYIGYTAHHIVFPVATHPNSIRRQCITLTIVDDDSLEETEMFFIELQSDPLIHRAALLGKNSTAIVRIWDDDTPGTCTIDLSTMEQTMKI